MHVVLLDSDLHVFSLQQVCGVHEAAFVRHFVLAGVAFSVRPRGLARQPPYPEQSALAVQQLVLWSAAVAPLAVVAFATS